MEYSEKLRNSSEKLKTQAKNSKTQAKNSRIRQIHLVYLPKTRPKKKAALTTLREYVYLVGSEVDSWALGRSLASGLKEHRHSVNRTFHLKKGYVQNVC